MPEPPYLHPTLGELLLQVCRLLQEHLMVVFLNIDLLQFEQRPKMHVHHPGLLELPELGQDVGLAALAQLVLQAVLLVLALAPALVEALDRLLKLPDAVVEAALVEGHARHVGPAF
jgi:hypothetical protein